MIIPRRNNKKPDPYLHHRSSNRHVAPIQPSGCTNKHAIVLKSQYTNGLLSAAQIRLILVSVLTNSFVVSGSISGDRNSIKIKSRVPDYRMLQKREIQTARSKTVTQRVPNCFTDYLSGHNPPHQSKYASVYHFKYLGVCYQSCNLGPSIHLRKLEVFIGYSKILLDSDVLVWLNRI